MKSALLQSHVNASTSAVRVPFHMVRGRAHSQLTLGTVQLGMKYGIANRTGMPPRATALNLVQQAISYGVTQLDTARAYGESESVLGEALQGEWRSQAEVITKLDPLAGLSADAEPITVQAEVDRSISSSRRELRLDSLPVLLLHRWQHRTHWNGAAWRRLLELKAQRTIGILGASVYEPWEALEALQDPEVHHLQLPMNLLDWRWEAEGVDRAISLRPDVVIHARSAFLQGVLLQPAKIWPVTDYDANDCVNRLREIVGRFGREGVADLCLAYLRAKQWITSIVGGCETMEQLEHTVSLFGYPPLTEEQCEQVERSLPRAPIKLLNPSQWKTT